MSDSTKRSKCFYFMSEKEKKKKKKESSETPFGIICSTCQILK